MESEVIPVKIFSDNQMQVRNWNWGLGRIGFLLGTVVLGQWVLTDFVHFPGGGLGLVVFGVGIYWLVKPTVAGFDSPVSVKEWIARLHQVLEDFKSLENSSDSTSGHEERAKSLDEIINRKPPLSLAFVGKPENYSLEEEEFKAAIASRHPFNIFWFESLSFNDRDSSLPEFIYEKDILIYSLQLPLKASDLLWLQKISEGQPTWIMICWKESQSWNDQLNLLHAQLPACWENRILRLDPIEKDIKELLNPIAKMLDEPTNTIDITRQRLLSKLHSSWQSDLEKLRRNKFIYVQNKTQWIVAGAVFASPIPSTDLLAVAVVNGLMIKEMAKIWSCDWKIDSLEIIAKHLVAAALAQGVVEWSGQALLSVTKFHGGSWLAAGTIQALSAAYLTRVVGRSMADWLALNNGVSEPDLEALKQEAPKLIANAAETERVDWSLFLKQANTWLSDNEVISSSFSN